MESEFHAAPKLQFNEKKPNNHKPNHYPIERDAQRSELPNAVKTPRRAWLIVDEDWW